MSEHQQPYELTPATTDHEHLYRVAVGGKSIVRYCERCGRTWLVTQLQDVFHPAHSEYIWTEVLDEAQASQRLIERSEKP